MVMGTPDDPYYQHHYLRLKTHLQVEDNDDNKLYMHNNKYRIKMGYIVLGPPDDPYYQHHYLPLRTHLEVIMIR
jgi:hypothetical protein